MTWVNDHIQVCHRREPWDADTPSQVLVHQKLNYIYGREPSLGSRQQERQELYEAAKYRLDSDAATEIVLECVRDPVLDAIVERVLSVRSPDVRVTMPHP